MKAKLVKFLKVFHRLKERVAKDRKKFIGFFLATLSLIYLFSSFVSYYQNKIGTDLYGNIDIREVDLGFRVSGKLQEIFVEEGDFVKEGQLLAKLDQSPFEQDVNMSKASYEVSVAVLKNAKLNFEMIESLYKLNIKSKYEYSNALMQIEEARANLLFSKAKMGSSIISLKDAELYSPSDGIITSRAFEKGAILSSSNSKIFTLSLTSYVYAKGYINEYNVGKIKIGDKVKVLTDSNSIFIGEISYISPNPEFTPKNIETRELRTDLVYKVHFKINDHKNRLHRGMPVTIRIKFGNE